jgi:tetratricopeptide (TPR) repeat protein
VWDDFDHVVLNERVTAPDGLVRSWRETRSPGFYPVTYTTFFAEWRLAGGKPWLFHLDNVLLHAGNAVLVLRLAQALSLPNLACWFVAAVWALHPVQAASVAWIAERKNVLYVFLYLSSLLLYLASDRAPAGSRARAVRYGASILLFALALLGKAAAMTLPAAIVLLWWARRGPLDRRLWLSLVPYALVAMTAGVALLGSVPAEMRIPSLATRLLGASRAIWFYVGAFLWPRHLLTMYPRWAPDPSGLRDALLWLGLVALAVVGVLVRRRVPRSVVFGVGLFAVNVALVVGFVWFTYLDHAPVADHLAYLPSLGLAFVAVGGLFELAPGSHVSARAIGGALGVWCALLALACLPQIAARRDAESYWGAALAANPDCSFCLYNLGKHFDDQGENDLAARHYERALRLEPDADTANNLGSIRLAEGRIDEATALYRRAAQLDPANEEVRRNLGLVLTSAGKVDEAIGEYRTALRLAPDDELTATLLANVFVSAGRSGEAVALLESALKRMPGSQALIGALAWIRATSPDAGWRDGAEAVRLGERACEIDGYRDAGLMDTLAAAYAEAGRFEDAVRTARRALEADPGPALAKELRERVALYEARRPFRSE